MSVAIIRTAGDGTAIAIVDGDTYHLPGHLTKEALIDLLDNGKIPEGAHTGTLPQLRAYVERLPEGGGLVQLPA